MRTQIIKYTRLLLSFAAIYILLVFVLPQISKIPYMSQLQECIKKWDINTTAIFYTDEISSKKEISDITNL